MRQVYLSSLNRKTPGVGKADELRYREGFLGLKMIGYQGYCSFERGDRDTFPCGVSQPMEFLRRVWAQA